MDAFAGRAVWALGRLGGVGAGAGGRWEGGPVRGRAGAFCAGVDAEGGLAALGAERVARVPVEEGARLGVDRGGGSGERGVHSTFEKREAARLQRGD